MVTLTDQDNGRSVTARVGEVLELHLAENATTGFRWAPDDYDATILELAEASADYPKAGVGAGGQAIFRFRVVGAGSGKLSLKYWRPFEGDRSIARRFAVTIEAAK